MTATVVTTVADLVIQQAAGFECVFIYCNPLPNTNPPMPDVTRPINVTGWSARFTIRSHYGGPVLAEASTADSGITVVGASGQFIVTFDSDQTAALERDGVYDLLAQNPALASEPERVAEGAILIDRAVTLTI